jgi:uncharacterized membrane protein
MEGLFPLLILLGIFFVLSGPVALVVGLVALSRIKQLQRERSASTLQPLPHRPTTAAPAAVPTRPVILEKTEPTSTVPERPPVKATTETIPQTIDAEKKAAPSREAVSLEQRIGTRWVLVAGVVTVIFAVGFFLKYAYDNEWIRPQTRVVIAAIAGLLALALGEVTRRRGYGIVAKGVTALGFATLYATVFTAHRWYALIDSGPAFALAIGVTGAAMLYAVALDEIVAALPALVGGYITPVVVSTGQNLPTPLFSYVLILSAGALLCAYWRKWPAVNILAFVGTFVLYTGWFEKFYRPVMQAAGPPDQLGVALFWVTVFFLVYLILPILHGLVRKVMSQTVDVVLLLANAAVVFYYFWTLLGDEHRTSLALCSLILGAAHLVLMGLVAIRYKPDVNLRQTLLAIGLVLITVAIPLYLKMYAVATTWAIEAVVLTVIGLRYRNVLVRVAAVLVLALAVERLVQQWPMHSAAFRVVLNPAFGTWCLVAAAILACHVLHRLDLRASRQWRSLIVEVLYAAGLLLLMAAVSQELWYHGDLNLSEQGDQLFFARHIALVFPGFLLLLVARPICPRGQLCSALAMVIALMGSLCTVIAFSHIHKDAYAIFLNGNFIRATVLVVALFAATWLLRLTELKEQQGFVPPISLAMTATVLLWILLTQEIWYFWRCLDRYGTTTANWRLLAHMCISIMWAAYATGLMVAGFWRRIKLLRYAALAAFVLLLGKIFIVDTRNVSSLYRIAGFLATGIALVGVSYLYQYLKKQGFFERMLADEGTGVP